MFHLLSQLKFSLVSQQQDWGSQHRRSIFRPTWSLRCLLVGQSTLPAMSCFNVDLHWSTIILNNQQWSPTNAHCPLIGQLALPAISLEKNHPQQPTMIPNDDDGQWSSMIVPLFRLAVMDASPFPVADSFQHQGGRTCWSRCEMLASFLALHLPNSPAWHIQ